ncbi:hypothetical protein RhiJN_18852 [Ceratobasidium sp. AG-Ba]|nr:hypothetical protein RhiJN_04033 [Ceratobasidium sp. AG-Ba]QRV90834.1 hypothetical protein RhiJN_18852 [Ceratobasidium sp. AG-Ba]
MLSDKARGKQKATDDDEAPESTRTITIRFTEREPDLLLGLSSKETVRDLRALARVRKEKTTAPLEAHARNAPTANRSSTSSPTSPTFPTPARNSISSNHAEPPPPPVDTWIHCSIGPEGEGVEDEEKQQHQQIKPLTGFDRLAAAGLSQEDIESMRRQFHAQRPEVDDGDDEHARALEEQWVDNMDAGLPGTDPADADPMYPPYLHGILMGFFFPLMPLFFLRELPPPAFFSDNVAPVEAPRSVVFSRRMQMALVAGFLANIIYGTLNYFY